MIGIVQGRLSYSKKKLQLFPKSPYREFKLAAKLGYDFIEFFAEKTKNYKNPIWSNSGKQKYIQYSKINRIKIFSFCDNYIINHSIHSPQTLREITNTLEQIEKLKIKKYILPLYGKSEIKKKNKEKIYKNLSIISNICKKKKIELLLESDMSPESFIKLKKKLNSKNCFFLFDTGNRIVLKRNPIKDILKLRNDLRHVHLKDKNIYNKNVIIGDGSVKFELIFAALKKINYKGSFTIESQRGKNIQDQAKKNCDYFRDLINRYLKK